MKLKPITRVKLNQISFVTENNELFSVEERPRNQMKIWKLHKRFRGVSEYRVLSSVETQVPVAIQRLKERAS